MSLLRNALGTAVGGTAQVLSLASKVLDVTAKSLRPDGANSERSVQSAPRSQPTGTAAVIADVADDVDTRGRVVEPAPTPMLDETPHVRTSETHIEELAAKPAAQVVAAVADLSTDELRLLTEYEMAHKNRRTVIAAIERAAAPG